MIGLLFFGFQSLSAQTSARLDSLRNAHDRLNRELKNLNVARDSTRSKKEATLAEITLINRQVYLREQLLKTMRAEIRQVAREIESTQTTITALEEEVAIIQDEYGKLMVVTYKALHNQSASFYLLSAKTVGQGYKRMQYFRAISRMQESRMKLLRRTKSFLGRKKHELELRKLEKVALAEEEKAEKAKMVALKDEQKRLYDQLKADEEQYSEQISQTKSSLQQLNKAISKEIARLADLNKPKTKAEKEDFTALNADFASNKGRLPWPLPKTKGTVMRKFGKQTLPGTSTTIDLQGIDIATQPGQEVRAIFKGKVAQVMPVPGQGKIVIVQHGAYYSVYANLRDVFVSSKDEINMLQAIGTARTDGSNGETKVHFQLYKARAPQNPESWLSRK